MRMSTLPLLVTIAALTLGACGGDGDSGDDTGGSDGPDLAAPTTPAPAELARTPVEIVPEDEQEAGQVYVGDCFVVDDVDSHDFDQEVPCTEEHNIEVVALLDEFDGQDLPEDLGGTFFPACVPEIDAALGLPIKAHGLVPAYFGSQDDNGKIAGPIACYVAGRGEITMRGSVLTEDPRDVTDWTRMTLMPQGQCFLLGEDASFGQPAPCEGEALVFLGSFESEFDGSGPHPGEDALREERDEKCAEILESLDLGDLADRVDEDAVSGTIPDDQGWDYFDIREISCDAPLT